MNKVLAFFMFVPMLFACTNGASTGKPTSQDSAVVSYTFEDDSHTSEARRALDPIVKQYPNYRDNEIAQNELIKPLEEYFSSCVGKPFHFIDNLIVEYDEIDKVNGDKATVWFKSVDFSNYGGDLWDCAFHLNVEMKKDEASKLSTGVYRVKGTLKKWDKNGRFMGTGFHVSSTIWLGTFVISDATVTK